MCTMKLWYKVSRTYKYIHIALQQHTQETRNDSFFRGGQRPTTKPDLCYSFSAKHCGQTTN